MERTEIEAKLGRLIHEISGRNKKIQVDQAQVDLLTKEMNDLNQQLCELDKAD